MFTPFTINGCSLKLLKPEEQGTVIFYQTQNHEIIKKLISMGITIGINITLKQNKPDLIIEIGDKSWEIEQEIASAIYLRIDNK